MLLHIGLVSFYCNILRRSSDRCQGREKQTGVVGKRAVLQDTARNGVRQESRRAWKRNCPSGAKICEALETDEKRRQGLVQE